MTVGRSSWPRLSSKDRLGRPRDQPQSCAPCESMVMEWAVNYAYERGDVVIDVAGNENQSTVGYPAAYDRAVVVAAVANSDVRGDLSNYIADVTVSAPEVDIYSAYGNGLFAWWSGAS